MTNPGIKWEYTIRGYLHMLGYRTLRSAGSRSPIDLLAWKGDEVVAIQAKKENKKTPYAKDVYDLAGTPLPTGWKRELWLKRARNFVEVWSVDESGEKRVKHRMSVRDMNALIRLQND